MGQHRGGGHAARYRRAQVVRAGAGAAAAVAFGAGRAHGQAAAPIRWDIVNLQPEGAGLAVSPGGEASARADNQPAAPAPAAGERITYTGNGVFVPGAPRSVSGGGTYTIRTAQGGQIGSGTFRVTELLSWDRAPGTAPPLIVANRIPVAGDPSAGLAGLRIAYSDGQAGILVVSCQLVDTPGAVFEGVVGTHGSATFWDRDAPQDQPFVNANRTLFTILRGGAPPPVPAVLQPPGPALRWDTTNVDPQPTGPIITAGGQNHARAASSERITWTGTGTFRPGAPRAVTGGGTFAIQGAQGQAISSGAFRVTELVSWVSTPGTFPAINVDRVGNLADARPGLATLKVAYSDGRQGVIVVSCRTVGTPGPVFEGMIGTHGFETYFSHEFAVAAPTFVNANRTVFHVLGGPLGLPRTGDGSAIGEDADAEEEGDSSE